MPQNDKALFLERFHNITPGTVTAEKALVVDANKDLSSLRHLTLDGSLTSLGAFPNHILENPSANSTNEFIGSIAWYGRDSGAATQLYGSLEGYVQSATAGAEIGWLLFNVYNGTGSFNPSLQMVGNNVMIGVPPSSSTLPGNRLNVIDTGSTTDDPVNVLRLQYASTGTPAAGIGVGIEFVVETQANNNEIIGTVQVHAGSVTSNDEDGAFHVNLMQDGTLQTTPQFSVFSNGFTRIKNDSFPSISFQNPTADANPNQFIASIEFRGEDSANNDQYYTSMECYVLDGTSGSEDSQITFNHMSGGSIVEGLRINKNSTAGDTSIMIFDVDNNTLERVSVGSANSGGAGFKLLRIPN